MFTVHLVLPILLPPCLLWTVAKLRNGKGSYLILKKVNYAQGKATIFIVNLLKFLLESRLLGATASDGHFQLRAKYEKLPECSG